MMFSENAEYVLALVQEAFAETMDAMKQQIPVLVEAILANHSLTGTLVLETESIESLTDTLRFTK